jgi:predicted O-linked N-acetylglucosamine transferase (SPINDLY family)
MDYRLTDAIADPPGVTEQFHTEQLVRLPEVFACFRPSEHSPPVGALPASTKGHITFASFHKLPKLNDRLLEWWAQILRQVPDSRILMTAIGLDEVSRQERLIDFFAGEGVALERLEFKGRQMLPQYLALHNEVDLLLDSHPFTGHTIGCHALWMGVPVVTLAGDRHCARMVASVLGNLGLPDLIARSPEEYVKIASELAANLPRLAELRSTLRERMRASPLTDAPHFARSVEQAYREMWRSWCARPGSP